MYVGLRSTSLFLRMARPGFLRQSLTGTQSSAIRTGWLVRELYFYFMLPHQMHSTKPKYMGSSILAQVFKSHGSTLQTVLSLSLFYFVIRVSLCGQHRIKLVIPGVRFPMARITGICHQTWLKIFFKNIINATLKVSDNRV